MKNKVEVWIRIDKVYDNPFHDRIRLIYPDGKTEWCDGYYSKYWSISDWKDYPCWHKNSELDSTCNIKCKSLMTQKEAIMAMKKYDRNSGYRSIKIGEL